MELMHMNGKFDAELHARALSHLAERFQGNIAAFAEALGADYSRAVLSKYLNQTYGNPKHIERALEHYFAREEKLAADDDKKFVKTEIARAFIAACRYARDYKAFVAIHGRSGNGKSTALKRFSRTLLGDQVVKIYVRSISTAGSFLRQMADELKLPRYGVADDVADRIVIELCRHPRLLLVDEASFLKLPALHVLRNLHEQTGCGVVLTGTRELMIRLLHPPLSSRLAEDLAQIINRVLMVELPAAVSGQEAREIARRRIPALSAEELEGIAGKPRTARAVVNLAERVGFLRRANPQAAAAQLVAAAESELLEATA